MRRTSAVAAIVVMMLTRAALCASATTPNLLLNAGAEGGKADQPSIWSPASVPAEGLKMGRDHQQAKSGKSSLFIENRHRYEQPVANNWVQALQAVPAAGTTLVLSAAVRTTEADAANVCLQCWDASGQKMLAFASTPVVRGDQDWIALRSEAVVVPAGTASVVVRAALAGTGKVWFDDITLSESTTPATTPAVLGEAGLDAELLRALGASSAVEKVIPIDRDQMVLSYLPDWAHGKVDNIAVANNQGGVRTLLAWPAIESPPAERRFLLALYSRDTRDGGGEGAAAGKVQAFDVRGDWNEETSWKQHPRTDEAPAAEFDFQPGNGWKIFDVTSIVRAQLKASGPSRGVLLRFAQEDRSEKDWNGYAFVSREGATEWATRRPVLLMVK